MAHNLTWVWGTVEYFPGKFGYAIGEQNVVKVTTNGEWDSTVGTLEFWARTTDASAGNHIVVGNDAGAAVWIGAAGGVAKLSGFSTVNVTISDGVWHHFAYVCNGTDARLYVDGVLVHTLTGISSFTLGSGVTGIGGLVATGSDWNGSTTSTALIDELRVSNSVRYSSAFTPPTTAFTTDANTTALYHFDGTIKDSAPAAVSDPYGTSILGDSPKLMVRFDEGTGPAAGSQIGGASAALTGTAVATPFIAGSVTAITIEAWVKTTAANGAIANSRNTGGPSFTLEWGATAGGAFGSAGELTFGYDGSGLYEGVSTTTARINDGNWHHVVAVWAGTSGVALAASQYTIYVDGVSVALTSHFIAGGTQTPPFNVGTAYVLGNNSNWGQGFTGNLDEVAIYTTALSAAQVAAHYAAATSTPGSTGLLPVTAGASSSATTIGTSTAVLGVAAALTAAAMTIGVTTGSLPVTVGATSSSSTSSGAATGVLPAGVGTDSTALTIGSTTGSLPVSAAMSPTALTVGATTGTTDVVVRLDAAAVTVNYPTTGTLPVTAGMDSTSGTVGVAVTTGTLPATVPLSAAATTIMSLGQWTAEQSQAALLDFEPVGGPLIVEPAIAVAPAWINEAPIRRQSHVMPALVPDADGHVPQPGAYTIVEGDVGVPHLFISNRDVTYWRNVPVVIQEWSSSLPGGDAVAAIDLPQLTFGDVPGVGDLAWLVNDAPAEIYLIDAHGARIQPAMFCGNLVSDNVGHSETDLTNGWHLEGSMSQANYQRHRMPTYLAATDIGPLITGLLNGVVSRRYAPLKPVNTTILTRDRGSYADTEWAYVHNLLGTAWTTDGHQWTISRTTAPRTFKLALKDTSTVHWTVTAGAPGIEADLTADQSNVVHAIYGRGVDTDGYTWAGWCYPNLHNDTAPPYPYSSAGTVMSIGSTDAGTVSGRGVSDWQERARQIGFRIATDGTYSSDDATTCREIQARYGLLIDGIVGPQTWTATWAVGSNAGSLDGAYRRPLAILSQVDPHLYAADGAVVGPNPAYQPKVIRREVDIDYGPGITKAEATKSAQQQLARDSQPGWVGKLTLKTDPHEGSRFLMFEGQNVKLRGFRGGDPLLHIVDTRKTIDTEPSVELTVDSKARDAMSVAAILSRDRATMADPLRRKRHQSRSSRVEIDTVVPFDGESGAGVIPRIALYHGLWSVVRIPISQVGTIAKIDVSTTGPASPFAFALFGAPIQPSDLVRLVGNPLTSSGPFTTHASTLEDSFGFIEGWGQSGQAAGYYPGSQASGALTGRLYETPGGLIYRSTVPPWVWVAMYAQSSCFISGRIYPSPVA